MNAHGGRRSRAPGIFIAALAGFEPHPVAARPMPSSRPPTTTPTRSPSPSRTSSGALHRRLRLRRSTTLRPPTRRDQLPDRRSATPPSPGSRPRAPPTASSPPATRRSPTTPTCSESTETTGSRSAPPSASTVYDGTGLPVRPRAARRPAAWPSTSASSPRSSPSTSTSGSTTPSSPSSTPPSRSTRPRRDQRARQLRRRRRRHHLRSTSPGPCATSAAAASGRRTTARPPLLTAGSPSPRAPPTRCFLTLFDQGDGRHDSAVFVDNIRYEDDRPKKCKSLALDPAEGTIGVTPVDGQATEALEEPRPRLTFPVSCDLPPGPVSCKVAVGRVVRPDAGPDSSARERGAAGRDGADQPATTTIAPNSNGTIA